GPALADIALRERGEQPAIAHDVLRLEKDREIGKPGRQQERENEPGADSAARHGDRLVEEAVAIGHQEQGERKPGPWAAAEFELDPHQPIDAEDAPGEEYAEGGEREMGTVPQPPEPGDVGPRQEETGIEIP